MDDILYVEGTGNYVTFVAIGRKIMSLMTLKDALDRLPGDRFLRIHRSYIVAFPKIDVIQREQVIIRGERIPIGEAYRSGLQKRIRAQSQ
jgi:DNA-binding LytR/AlgR family response regulator